jgi:hypothetical protein
VEPGRGKIQVRSTYSTEEASTVLGPEDFTIIVLVLLGVALIGVLAVGALHRHRSGSGPEPRPRPDPIAEGKVTGEDVGEMLAAENARLRAHGRRPFARDEFESRLVGDRRFLHRVMRLRLRRRPDRARPLA